MDSLGRAPPELTRDDGLWRQQEEEEQEQGRRGIIVLPPTLKSVTIVPSVRFGLQVRCESALGYCN